MSEQVQMGQLYWSINHPSPEGKYAAYAGGQFKLFDSEQDALRWIATELAGMIWALQSQLNKQSLGHLLPPECDRNELMASIQEVVGQKTCKTCKHWYPSRGTDKWGGCGQIEDKDEDDSLQAVLFSSTWGAGASISVRDTFGCNLWEADVEMAAQTRRC